MRFEAVIGAFAAALENPSAPPPAGVLGRLGAPDARRFSVYRNNVAVSLIAALEARYPVARAILGDERFRDLARAFMRARKPSSPVMIAYGGDFPDFLAEAAPDGVEAEIVDVARLENAWVEAYHAEEAAAATLADLAALEPATIACARVALHPATRLLRFATPAATLWELRQRAADPARDPLLPAGEGGEDALITRPAADVLVRVLPPEAYDFALSLAAGATLAAAAGALGDPHAFGTHLVGFVEAGALCSIHSGEPS
jgi:hypothetical protein